MDTKTKAKRSYSLLQQSIKNKNPFQYKRSEDDDDYPNGSGKWDLPSTNKFTTIFLDT